MDTVSLISSQILKCVTARTLLKVYSTYLVGLDVGGTSKLAYVGEMMNSNRTATVDFSKPAHAQIRHREITLSKLDTILVTPVLLDTNSSSMHLSGHIVSQVLSIVDCQARCPYGKAGKCNDSIPDISESR